MANWLYEGSELESIPEGVFGFVYLITNTQTGRMYIGKKQFNSYRSKKIKGKTRKKRYVLESDWKEYWGSCEELKEDIQKIGEENFKREIIKLCKTKGELTYSEVETQIKVDCLTAVDERGNRLYYNSNIMSRWFAKNQK
jgi:serine/threonine protein kinase